MDPRPVVPSRTARALRGAADVQAARHRLVAESWQRSLSRRLDPDGLPRLELPEDDLESWRREHPLALLLPVVRKLLVDDAEGSGLLVAVGDELGRLLWVEGDHEARRRAESMLFVAGAGWSEARVGTSAPGTALALDRGVQIRGAEHFNHLVQEWSCTAVPVHDPADGRVIGVVDITGDDRAAGDQTLPLLRATVAAMEAQLALSRSLASRSGPARASRRPSSSARGPAVPADAASVRRPIVVTRPRLDVLGRDEALLHTSRGTTVLSARHSEIALLLASRAAGWTAAELGAAVWPEASSTTLRAEMVRLRHVLEAVDPALAPLSRPYRFAEALTTDVGAVVEQLDRGAHRSALRRARGPVLPSSRAPGVVELRDDLRERLGESVRASGSVDALLEWVASEQGADDDLARHDLLRLLPPHSPRRAGLVAGARPA